MVLALMFLCLGSVTILVIPLAFRDLIDFGFGQNQKATGGLFADLSLNQRFLSLFGLACLWAVMISARYYTVSWIGERVIADLRSAVYGRVLLQSAQFFETLQTGEVLSRLTGDTTLIQTVVGSSVSMGLRSLFQFVGGMAMLAATSFYLFSLNLGLMALLIIPLLVIGRKVKKLSRESQDKIADASALAGEILNAVSTVQAYSQERSETDRFTASAEASFKTAIRRTRTRGFLTAFIVIAVMGSIIFVLWIGANLVQAGSMTGGQLASFILYAVIVASATSTIAEVWSDIMRAAGATGRLLELLHAKPAIAEDDEPQLLTQTGKARIQFERVTFRYPSRLQTAALDDLTFDIAPGEKIALVGPSGAGKTTVFQLLLRFYDTTEGVIRFNNHDVRRLSLQELRNNIAIVPQDPVIFSADALDNIRYGRPDASEEEIIAAARSAQVDEFIHRLPEGYRTFLGERGTRLSGGQRQRIAIARAILKNAPLLLLDEATSALDANSEILVQEGLDAAMLGRTTIIIAHRLATVKKVDRVIVLDQGRIIETGSPDELLKQNGLYAKLASLQFTV
ncbi:MAG: ATP-binding cassette domain-containing protein [Methylococcaceae bacterium]|nr:ATP-binding cassette domain-containing protein [Methylococcaceae bacterium]